MVEFDTPMPPVFSQVKLTIPGLSVSSKSIAPPVERKLLHFLLSHQAGDVLRGGIHHGSVRHHLHLLAHVADRQTQIDGSVLPHYQRDAGADPFGKAGLPGPHVILADGKSNQFVSSGLVGDRRAGHACVQVVGGDGGAGHNGAGLVRDPARQACGHLRSGRERTEA